MTRSAMPRSRLRRTAHVLPHSFTLAALFCGFFSVVQSFGAPSPGAAGAAEGLYTAALAILFGAFFDAFDGRVARLTRTESVLGLELDSLADVVTFGVAPASLVYNWSLGRLGLAGLLICFGWVACGAYRLARFNVLAHQAAGARPGPYIVGLPIPAAAAVIVSLVVVAHRAGAEYVGTQGTLAVIVVALSYLMVSRIRFRSFKAVAWRSRRTLAATVLVVLSSVAVWVKLQGAHVFVFLLGLYITLGIAETLLARAPRRDDAVRQGL